MRPFRPALAVFTALAMLVTAAAADEFPALYRVTGVAQNDALYIRAEPDAGSAIIGFLSPDQSGVEITALSPDGRWGQVNYFERAGWSHMRYLERAMAGSWRDAQTSLSCYGTEPYWRLSLFLPTDRAEFGSLSRLDDEVYELVTDSGALPATRFPPVLAIPFSGTREGAAILRGEDCNDGMSDQEFAISAFLYFRGDSEAFSGCCRLE
ncbi:MAG: SH3 domain-containing protein [Pararhodobacter sp.]|nr:SH3 domain-containing protein [Pararhodobacter sp.]